jgi:hypothetical protein
MQLIRVIAAVLCAVALGAAEKPVQKPKTPPLPPGLQPIYEMALAAPPEFASDALLRLAASPAISDRALQRRLIEQAFQFGSRAHELYQRVSSDPGDTRPALIATALLLKLDALSLQSRAVTAMASVDPQTALTLLSSIPRPSLEPLKCEEPLVPMIGEYYAAVAAVANHAFRDPDDRTQFLGGVISGVASIAEVLPAADMLTSIVTAPPEATILYNSFAAKVASLPADPRTFVAYATRTEQSFQAMLLSARGLGVASEPLDASLNAYLGKQKSPGCGDQKPKSEPFWQSETAKRVFQTGRRLWFRPEGTVVTDADRATPEWARQLTDFLSSLDNWSAGDERSEADYFHQRAFAYEGVLRFAPAGPMRDQVLRTYLGFLTQSNLQQQSPVEWYWHAHAVLNRSADQESRNQIVAAFRQSGNTILVLEAALEGLGTPAGGPKFSLL